MSGAGKVCFLWDWTVVGLAEQRKEAVDIEVSSTE